MTTSSFELATAPTPMSIWESRPTMLLTMLLVVEAPAASWYLTGAAVFGVWQRAYKRVYMGCLEVYIGVCRYGNKGV